MKLLPENSLIRTSRVDHADWNYRPLLSYIMRRRFALILSLLPHSRVPRLLEIGFGSGIFLPELAQRCDELYGIDVHQEIDAVQTRVRQCGMDAALSRQSAASLNYPDAFFDIVVSVSTLEFIDDIDSAAKEVARVLTPQGRLVAVMPKKSALLDLALRAVTGENAERDYGDRRERVLPALLKHFVVSRTASFSLIYTAYEFAKE